MQEFFILPNLIIQGNNIRILFIHHITKDVKWNKKSNGDSKHVLAWESCAGVGRGAYLTNSQAEGSLSTKR